MKEQIRGWRRTQLGFTRGLPFVWVEGASWHPIGRVVEIRNEQGEVVKVRAGGGNLLGLAEPRQIPQVVTLREEKIVPFETQQVKKEMAQQILAERDVLLRLKELYPTLTDESLMAVAEQLPVHSHIIGSIDSSIQNASKSHNR